jgi:hypothetical protein
LLILYANIYYKEKKQSDLYFLQKQERIIIVGKQSEKKTRNETTKTTTGLSLCREPNLCEGGVS